MFETEGRIWKSCKKYHDEVIFSEILLVQVDLASRNWTVLLYRKNADSLLPMSLSIQVNPSVCCARNGWHEIVQRD